MRIGLTCLLGISLVIPRTVAGEQASQTTSSASAKGDFQEEVVAEIPAESEVRETHGCADHVAWVQKQNGKHTVKLDGKQQGASYDEVKYLQICAQPGHLAFFGKRNSRWISVVDGTEGSQEFTSPTSIAFQPKGTSYAFGGCVEKNCHLYVDGKETGAEYQDISYPRYSADGKRLAYFGKQGKTWTAVVDGNETGPRVFLFFKFGFSPGGARFYVASSTGFMASYIVDGVAGPDFPVISPITFSPDEEHYVYGGTTSQSGFKKQRVMGSVLEDGKVVVSVEGKGLSGSWTMLGGSQETLARGVREFNPDFDGISSPDINPEGKLVYAVRRDKGDIAVLVGGEPGPGFQDILSPVAFTEDSEHFVYIARRGGDFVEVRDNVAGRTHPAGSRAPTLVPQIMMNKDATHIAYETVEGGNQFKAGRTARALRSLVIDGQETARYDALGIFIFGADKDFNRRCFVVRGAKGDKNLVSVNGQESKLYDEVSGARVTDEQKSVTFFARDGRRVLRVTYEFQ